MFRGDRLVFILLFSGVLQSVIPQSTTCIGQTQECGILFTNAESATSLDAVCGASSPLKQCIDGLEDKCDSITDPYHRGGILMVQFHKYMCSSQGQTDVTALASCGGPSDTCNKQPRTTTEESCTAAKMYVKCIKDQCGQQAADYALTLDKFSIEVQGGTCDFQASHAESISNRGMTVIVFLASLATALL